MAAPAYIHPFAAWRVTLDGKDLSDKINPRLVSLRLSEKRGEASDELELVLHDHDGRLDLPKEGARLTVALGWARGRPVVPGLVEKGSFLVDEVDWEGPPDLVTIRARGADFAASFRTRKTRVWKNRTLGQIVGQLGADNGLTPRCHADLAGKAVALAEQANKSDMEFLRDLGRRYDAVATVKDKHLIFAPIDADTTATGKAIPALELDRSVGDKVRYNRAARERAEDGAEANWHDGEAAQRRTTGTGGTRRRRLKRVYASEGDAKAASQAETNRLKRAAAKLDMTLAWGNPLASVGQRAKVTGCKPEITSRKWRIASVEHEMDASGYRTRVEMEAAE